MTTFPHLVLSTDREFIAALAKLGCKVIMRPPDYRRCRPFSVVIHAARNAEDAPQFRLLLQPTVAVPRRAGRCRGAKVMRYRADSSHLLRRVPEV